MTALFEDQIKSILENIISKHNLTNYVYYSEQTFKSIQNYFGVLIPVTLKSEDDKNPDTIELVLKLSPSDQRFRVSGAVTNFFACEIFVYSILFQEYKKIQDKFSLNLQFVMPKCYYICKDYCNEVVAMENMNARGFKPFSERFFLDYDHIVVSLRSLAKFHALSFLLRNGNPRLFEEVTKICVPLNQETNSRFMTILLNRLDRAIEKFQNTKYMVLLKSMREHCVKHVEAAAFSVKQLCICHGDLWAANILYKYKENIPVEACIVDYQTVRMSSAAFDTLYLITTSTSKQLRERSFHKFLDIYYDTFAEFLKEGGLESQNIFCKKIFHEDLKTVAPCCFIIANTALWLKSGLQEEGHVRSKTVFTTPEQRDEAMDQYRGIIKGIIEDYISYGYFSQLEN